MARNIYNRRLTDRETDILDSIIKRGWNMEDEELFKNSVWYRKVIGSPITDSVFQIYGKELQHGEYETPYKIKFVSTHIRNSFIRNYLNYQYMSTIMSGYYSSDADKQAGYQNFMATAEDSAYIKEIQFLYNNFKKYADNKPAPDFNYQDVNGKLVALNSLRGKYVYLDIWATWCGPCKAEMPFLAKIEEMYENRNIHFVSLSVDNTSDRTKWKNFVQENNLKGIQIMADNAFSSSFIRSFNIQGIPRFILIDPQGIIVAADAKRPSDPLLKTQLDKLLMN